MQSFDIRVKLDDHIESIEDTARDLATELKKTAEDTVKRTTGSTSGLTVEFQTSESPTSWQTISS